MSNRKEDAHASVPGLALETAAGPGWSAWRVAPRQEMAHGDPLDPGNSQPLLGVWGAGTCSGGVGAHLSGTEGGGRLGLRAPTWLEGPCLLWAW